MTRFAPGEADVRILRGHPTEQEIAALVAVVAMLGAGRPRTDDAQPRLVRRRSGHRQYQHRSAASWRGRRP
ncbi:acyl-CoA carboxylase subunit epsilon [Actinocrinis sp.]|uniref:acyl-CoA carboxylase subunit epsilon n=1 Tax=Actinocrinis sp. TaxID=1920516 RepID=UPI002D23B5BA|nr:acyl-CoA carboxylase subunit epsilon [Actinocrinis sp.]HZP50545.1 acyl-CoA carboxylase subunit epsilon [Actinocrinis sp.]